VNMFARQALALAFAGAVPVGCAANAVPGASAVSGANGSSAFRSLALAAPNSTPTIKKVTPIGAAQYQPIVIKGTGFGKMKPYNGDSCCIEFIITNSDCYNYYPYNTDTWHAGYSPDGNEVGLNVTKWSNKKIVITGFTGPYGAYCWFLVSGQPITLNVWNAQTKSGPATYSGTVQ
jgi:hypothetical protein